MNFKPASAYLERFRTDLGNLVAPGERIGLAVSGGPDSFALLLLANAALPGRVAAATVDHGLRRESTIEALHVEAVCEAIACEHSTLATEVAKGPSGLQGEARRARYRALSSWAARVGLTTVATAHHADDQAETLMMRLQRGSGLPGLSGIRPVRREGELRIVRPLLGWTKAELVHIVAEAGIEPVDDPSNIDPRFDRTAARQFLSQNPQFAAQRLARSASAISEANDALEWLTHALFQTRCAASEGTWRIDPAELPREVRRRLLSRTIQAIRAAHGVEPPWTGGEDVEGLLQALERGESATLAGVLARPGESWQLRLAPPRRNRL